MGKSARAKKEKKKDFQKPKLKVGKAKPQAANFTDTSFKARSIVLSKQSLSTAAPSTSVQFSHNVSLLRHKSESQRQESLAYLTSALASRTLDVDSPEVAGMLLPKLQPMLLDGSPGVRTQLLKLLRCIPDEHIKARADSLIQYTHAAMTHLSLDVRSFSVDVLEWLLECAGQEAVSCVGGWQKTLSCFMGLVGWQGSSSIQDKGWSTYRKASVKAGSESKAMAKQVIVLASLIRTGLGRLQSHADEQGTFPIWHVQQHLTTADSNRLSLFGVIDQDKFPDREDRQRVFAAHFQQDMNQGLDGIQKEGGELGRAGAGLRRALKDCVSSLH